MPAIGAEVADAYIEVHADTGPFRRELRREASLAAREASDDFGVEFTKAIDKDLDPLGVKVSRQLRKMGELGGQNLIEEIADQVRSRADRINKAFAQSITFGDFAPFIESFNNFDDAIQDFSQRLRALNKDGTLTEKTFKRLDAAFNAYVKTIQDDAVKQALDDQRKASVAALEAEEKRLRRQEQINAILTKSFQSSVDKMTASQQKLSAALAEPDRSSDTFKVIGRDLDTLKVTMEKAARSAERFNIGLGSLKGSRNDFLNFIGTLSGFLERNIGRGLQGMFQGIGSGVTALGRSLASADGPLGSVGKKLDSFGGTINKLGSGGLDGLIIQIAALVIGLQLLTAVLGPIAAGISGVASAFTSLAVGIGGGLLGGIVALGPALTAVGVGAAAVAIGFSKLDKAQKAVFDPLKELFDEVRSSIQERLFSGLGGQIDALTTALAPVGPFLTRMAGVFADWVAEVVGEIGPGGPLDATFRSLGDSLPRIFDTLLNLVSATGGALTGLFAGAAPGAQRLFEGITRVVEQFSAWANTAAGQQQINTFMQQAVDILGLLWDIAVQVGAALGALWGGGAQQAASQLLTLVRNLTTSFTEWLNDPGNRQALLDFFNNGVRVAQSLGTVIGALISLFGALDTQFTRAGFQILIGHVVAAIDAFTKFATWTQNVFVEIGRFGTRVGEVASKVGNFATSASTAGQNFRTTLSNAFQAVGDAIVRLIAWFNRLPSPMKAIGQAAQNARSVLANAFNSMASAVGGAVGRAVGSLMNLAVSVAGAVGRAAGSLRGLAGQAAGALGSFAGAIARGVTTALGNLGRFVAQAPGMLGGLAGRFVSIGASIMQGLYNGVVSGAGRVLSYIGGLAGQVAATFAKVLGISSPSKVFRDMGGFTIDGFIQGMERRKKAAEKEAGTVAEGVIRSAINTLNNQQDRVDLASQTVFEALLKAGRNPRLNKAFQQLGAGVIVSLTNGLSRGREAASADVKRIVESIGKVAERAMKGEDKKTRKVIQDQAASLRRWVQGQAAALDAVWREVDRAGARIEAARDKLADLQQQYNQMRESTRNALRGELDLGAGIQDDGTATFESVASQVSGLAARMKKFAGLIKKLIKAGFPPALVQEVAALGTTEGIAVANALLSGTKAQQKQLIADFGSINTASDAIGKSLAEQMYRTGIEAQKGLIRGLEANREALIKAAKKIAKTIAAEVRRELGIKSPSRVFEEIGKFITEGLAIGIESGTSRVNSAMSGLVDTTALNNLNSPISAMANQGTTTTGSAAVGGIESGAITIVTPFANPRLVAIETLDALAARGK